jgi:predicted AAA+ superfamily ATPase
MDRIYKSLILKTIRTYPQMVFLVGPRQVGKTTLAKQIRQEFSESLYLNWDVVEDRQKILSGQKFVEDHFPINVLKEEKPLIIFDEIHKYKNWKNYLKGFYDLYKDHYHIMVTGSARLDMYQAGGDSLMGRYFQYHIHPLTTAELVFKNTDSPRDFPFQPPHKIAEEDFHKLYSYGGFPDPFLHADDSYQDLWQSTRSKQLIYEDIQSVAQIHDIAILEVLTEIIKSQTGQMLNRSNYAKKLQVSTQTIARWIATLEQVYYCYAIHPWHKNVMRSLIKEPKLYLWDWSLVKDEGQRFENFVASHLIKFAHFWSNQGKGHFKLYYLRDLDKREVDFLLVKDEQPWLMVETKLSEQPLSRNLEIFQQQLQALWSFQIVKNKPYVDKNCFDLKGTWQAPAMTFLSQLI